MAKQGINLQQPVIVGVRNGHKHSGCKFKEQPLTLKGKHPEISERYHEKPSIDTDVSPQ
jgi:hypothetical protein